ncbi:carbohydrate kinase [Demequina sp. NBRC 110052]|uniref:carbohydrate kinase family protein n=1 Tax=Demequina sp. NBRC 110052 TaxID=1570341 RepID=UPI001F486403|nr:carbohydrate kinase [Demequina sp. NBRC 110052]
MESPKILVVGEALMDVVDGVEIVGGSPANVALGLGRLGVDVELLTAVADDERGRRIVHHLEDSGVVVRPESFCLERTSTARASIGVDGSATYEFDIRWDIPAIDVSDFDAIHVGSIACFLEPGATVVLELVREAALDGKRVTFDPNIRPALVDSARGAQTSRQIAALSHVVKLSDEDAAAVYPSVPLSDVAQRLLDLGPDLVAITRGGDGALLASHADRVDVVSQPVDVVDTVGAGDTFMAALIATTVDIDLAGAAPGVLREVGEYCASAAAITVARAGADLPTATDLAQALAPPRP